MKKMSIYISLLILPLCIFARIAQSNLKDESIKINMIYQMIKDFPAKLRSAPTFSSKKAYEEKTKEKTIFVDVRKIKEMKVSMIQDAVGKNQFVDRMDEYKGHTIIVYCTIGYRSAKYTLELNQKGYKAYNLEGGVLLWTFAGYDLFDNKSQLTYNVHVYGKRWNLLPEKFKGVW